MTININEVHEIIKNLEGSGELSIKEEKYLNVAKLCVKLAAENVELKTFCKNAAFDADYESELGMERGGFTDALNNIETSVTDRLVAGIKADEEKEVLNDLLRHLEKIDIGSLSSPWELSSEVVAFVNSRLLREGADK